MARRRSGYTIIGLLVVVVIIALLWKSGIGTYFKPAATVNEKAVAKLPDEASKQMFHLMCDQARTVASMIETQGGPKPRTWMDLRKAGLEAMGKDPWGGEYYLKDGYVRCTGNPKIWEKL